MPVAAISSAPENAMLNRSKHVRSYQPFDTSNIYERKAFSLFCLCIEKSARAVMTSRAIYVVALSCQYLILVTTCVLTTDDVHDVVTILRSSSDGILFQGKTAESLSTRRHCMRDNMDTLLTAPHRNSRDIALQVSLQNWPYIFLAHFLASEKAVHAFNRQYGKTARRRHWS